MKRQLAAATVFALLCAGAFAQEQSVVDGRRVDDIISVARNFGSATLESQQSGAPRIAGRIEGTGYQVYFLNCDDQGRNCADLNFYAGFLNAKLEPDKVNRWNADKRFGRVYLDQDGDAVIEMDLNVQHGVTRANLAESFAIWRLLLAQFTDYLSTGAPAPAQ